MSQVRIAVEESIDVIAAHRFVREARARRLTEEQCRRWLVCAGTLAHELGDGKRHIQLLDDVGIPRAALCSYRRKAGIRFAIALARNVSAQPDPAVAMGYKLAHEGLSPVVHGAVDLGIRHRHPGLVTDFFRTPVEAEAGRVDRLFAAIARLGDDDDDGVVFGVNLGERGMAALLDEALGVFAHWQRT